MNESTSRNGTPRRRTLRRVLLGCAMLVGLLVCALALNAAYWTVRMRPAGAALDPAVAGTPVSVESLPAGDAVNGEALFRSEGCFACHALQPGETGVGPSLAGVAARAGGQSDPAGAYLVEAIVDPGAFVVEGFQDGVMPPNYGQRLSAQQLADLVAFLMSQ